MSLAPSLPSAPTYVVPGPMLIYRSEGSWLAAFPGGASGRVVDGDGTVRFVLGVLDYDSSVVVSVGDYVEVGQLMPLDDVDTVVFDATAVVGAVAAGRTWYAKILVDDVELAALALPSDGEAIADEAAAPVRRYSGEHIVAFRLEVG